MQEGDITNLRLHWRLHRLDRPALGCYTLHLDQPGLRRNPSARQRSAKRRDRCHPIRIRALTRRYELGGVQSGPTISRYRHGSAEIDPKRKAGELALLLVRLFRSLDLLVGADTEKRKAWMHTRNKARDDIPARLIRTPQGLVETLAYLDGIRAPA